ncbi:MAG: ATP-binding cassette domain-containing protein [Cyclobacteriaceae bacterium]|nr:ATP-binding cassette domain-containing protein [Cyclobacteriaceae bacterium]
MTSNQIIQILKEAALSLRHDVDPAQLQSVESNNRNYSIAEWPELKRDLIEAGRKIGLLILDYKIPKKRLLHFLNEAREPVLLFNNDEEEIHPLLIQKKKRKLETLYSHNGTPFNDKRIWLANEQGETYFLVIMPYKSVVSNYSSEEDSSEPLSPAKRLFRLLASEKKDIFYILVYALFIGLVSLILPLGLQATVEFISGGVFFSSVYVLIGLVIMGVLVTGGLQLVQISLVEHLQRRVFTRAAFEFAFRIPRIRMEALTNTYVPELINRFFDIITIQKGFPKLLIDLSAGIIQIFFGLLLLSLYHPFFVFFSFFLLLVFFVIFYLTGSSGLNSALNESKYKYKVVQWLEELGRTINSFKLAGNTDLPIRKTDEAVSNYLKSRKTHFGVLLTQFSFFVLFKVAVTAGLLIVGTILVINREITLGQFVASELIIILVLNAVEKIFIHMDVVYDLLTAVDKVSHVTDLPLDKSGGFDFPDPIPGKGYEISISNLRYKFKGNEDFTLKDISLHIQPKEKVCIAGPGSSGKTTLTNIVTGLYTEYQGGVSINGYSLHDLDIGNLRDNVAKNISQEDIFDGTIYENITVGKSNTSIKEVMDTLDKVGLKESISTLPNGLHTHVVSGGKGLPSSIKHRLILGRCMVKKPELMVLNDFFSGLSKADKLQLLRCVINPESNWTLLTVSNDPIVMAASDRVIIMDEGKIVADDAYNALLKQGLINQYFE